MDNQKHTQLVSSMKRVTYHSLGEFFASPVVATLCQSNFLLTGISTYFGGHYGQEQFETLTTLVHLLHARLLTVENKQIDIDFLESKEGKRIMGKIIRGVLRDNRVEKIEAMSNLTANLFIKSKLNLDEREIYVDILDGLNVLQLSILQRAILEIRNRTTEPHKGFSWEKLAKEYEGKGVTGALLLQSIRALESNGLVNQNNDAIHASVDQTHFVTAFGEQFYSFISRPLNENEILSSAP